MATDEARLFVRIEAMMRDFQKQMAVVAKTGGDTASGITKDFANQNNKVKKGFQDTSKAAVSSVGQVNSSVANLGFQLNDIATSLASGASPFQVLAQQGGQVSQVMLQMSQQGKGVSGVLSGIGGAFMTMVHPISLVSLGLIAAIGYLYQYVTTAEDGAVDVNKALDSIISKLGDLAPAATESLKQFQFSRNLREQITEIEQAIASLKAEATGKISGLDVSELEATSKQQFIILEKWQAIADAVEAGQPGIREAKALITDIAKLEPGAGNAAALQSAKDILKTLEDRWEAEKALVAVKEAAAKADVKTLERQKAYNKALEEMGRFAPQMSELEKLWKAYADAIANATTEAQRHNAEVGLARGLTELNTKALEENARTATELIKKEEDFRARAYSDKRASTGKHDAWRVGFGSDTYVDEMNRVQTVTKDTVVTLEQANADLARRIGEFQATIQRQIGPDMWRSLAENQQAALTSLAYNYGSLPSSIVKALKAGDQGQVAQAIAALPGGKGGMLTERRRREAELYASGSAVAGDALKRADEETTLAEKRADANEKLKEMLQTEQQAIALREQINAINADLSLKEDARALAIARVTAEAAKEAEVQKLLTQAKEAGLAITPELIAQYNALAQSKVNAIIQDKQLAFAQRDAAKAADEQKRAQEQLAQQITQMAQSAVGGLVNDLRNGVEAGEAFNNMLNRIIDSLIEMSIQSLFSKQGFGGIINTLFGVGGAAKGGIVGKTAFPQRMVNPAVFAGAPHFAGGGMVGGLRSGEVPIIAHRGEVIIPKGGKVAGTGGQTTVNNRLGNISIDMSSTGLVAADNESARKFGQDVQKLIQLEMVRESRPGGLLRRVPG